MELRPSAYPAKWDKYGKSAGFIGNQEMLDMEKPDLIVSFPGGRRGAEDLRKG